MDLTYRYLEPEDLPAAKALMEAHNFPFPDPRLSQFVGMFAPGSGQLVGVVPLQFIAHAEPVVVEKDVRARVDWAQVVALLNALCTILGLRGFAILAQERHVELLARRCGMTPVEGRVFEYGDVAGGGGGGLPPKGDGNGEKVVRTETSRKALA